MTRIQLETHIRAPIDLVFDLARDLDVHQASMAHTNERAIGGTRSGMIELGQTVTWRARHLGRTWQLTSRITEMDPPNAFADEQVAGPFAAFHHRHQFTVTPDGTRMTDEWEHTPPFGLLGRITDRLILRRHMHRLLSIRNDYLKHEAERRWAIAQQAAE